MIGSFYFYLNVTFELVVDTKTSLLLTAVASQQMKGRIFQTDHHHKIALPLYKLRYEFPVLTLRINLKSRLKRLKTVSLVWQLRKVMRPNVPTHIFLNTYDTLRR